jgi:hypothetical protein
MRKLLANITQNELLDFLDEYAKHDSKFENALQVRFGEPDFHSELKKISRNIEALLDDVSDWDAHDSWGHVSVDTSEIFYEAEQRVKRGQIRLAFAVLETLYVKLLENFEYQGECELADEAENCLARMAELAQKAASPEDQAYIFECSIALADLDDGKDYGADYEDQLLAIAAKFVTQENRAQLEAAVSRYESSYRAGAFALIHLHIIQKLDGQKAADAFVTAHLEIEEICKIAVEKAIEKQDYTRAEELCVAYIEQNDTNAWHWPKGWYALLLSIHEKTGDIEKQIALASKLLLEKHEYDDYAVLKKLLKKHRDWKVEYPALRDQCAARLPAELYMKILRKENEAALLLAEVQKKQSMIFEYGSYLAKTYPVEAYCMFWDEIKSQAEQAHNRTGYQEICAKILLLAKAGGVEDAHALIDLLRQRNPRRPAFLDELRQVETKIQAMGGTVK